MPNTRTIAEALRYSDADVAYVERRGSRWRRITLAGMWLWPVVNCAIVVWRAVLSWGDGQWDTHVWPTLPADPSLWRLWFIQLPTVLVIFLFYWEGDLLLAQSRMRPGLAQLLNATSVGDGQLTPRAAVQPVQFPSPLLTSRAIPIIVPSHLGKSSHVRLIDLSGVALLISMIGMVVIAVILPASDGVRIVGLLVGGILLVMLVPCLLILRRLPVSFRGEQAKISVDADGLSWTRGTGMWTGVRLLLDARVIRVPWHDLRAFFTFAGVESGIEHRLYALATANEIFTWEVRSDSPDDAREMSDLLCRLVATYTRLPLRDISAAVAILDDVTPRAVERADASGRRDARADTSRTDAERCMGAIPSRHAWPDSADRTALPTVHLDL